MDTISNEETSFSTDEVDTGTESKSKHVEGTDYDGVNLVSKPSRVLYFSDGTLDESELEEDEPDTKANLEVDPKSLSWGPWMLHVTTVLGSKTLNAVDYVGESLANFFGITSPKYQYEIDEYEIMRSEEEEAKKRHDLELGGWTSNASSGENTIPSEGGDKDVILDGAINKQPHSLQSSS